jgi:hypothetical protein
MNVRLARLSGAIGVVILAVVLAACGGRGQLSTATPAGPRDPGTSVFPSPVRSGSVLYARVGQSVVTLSGLFRETALAYRQPTAPSAAAADQPGFVWGAAQVQDCLIALPSLAPPSVAPAPSGAPYRNGWSLSVAVRPGRWQLRFADSSVVKPTSREDRQFVQPAYPRVVPAVQLGRCVSGWITFAVPAAAKPIAIEYAPKNETIDWSVG